MSDIEIIQAIRSSDPVLENTPLGVLSIIAHYSRPNVLTFSKTSKTYTMHHCSTGGGTYSEQTLECPYSASHIIGVDRDTIYLKGFNSDRGWSIFSFDIRTRTFRYRLHINCGTALCILSLDHMTSESRGSKASMYISEFSYWGMFSFYKHNLITGESEVLLNMSGLRSDYASFLYKDNIYIFGGNDNGMPTTKCERFDTKENKWIETAPMRYLVKGIHVTAKDNFLYLIAEGGDFLMYDPEKNKWTILKRDDTLAAFPLETFQYNKGKLVAITQPTKDSPSIVLEVDSTTQQFPWEPVLTIGKAGLDQKNCTYLVDE